MNNIKKIWYHVIAGGGGGSSYSAGYQAILDRATALGAGYEHPSDAENTALNNFYVWLNTNGVIDRADIIRVLAPSSCGAGFRMINWADPNSFLGTMPAGDLTYLEEYGLQAGNSSKYIDDNYNPTNDGAAYTQNNASAFYYRTSVNTISTANGHLQSVDDIMRVQPRRSTGAAYVKLNGNNVLASTSIDPTLLGLYGVMADMAQTNEEIARYRDNTLTTGLGAVSTIPNSNFRSCWYGDDHNAFYCYGEDIRDLVADLEDQIETLLAELFFLNNARSYWNFENLSNNSYSDLTGNGYNLSGTPKSFTLNSFNYRDLDNTTKNIVRVELNDAPLLPIGNQALFHNDHEIHITAAGRIFTEKYFFGNYSVANSRVYALNIDINGYVVIRLLGSVYTSTNKLFRGTGSSLRRPINKTYFRLRVDFTNDELRLWVNGGEVPMTLTSGSGISSMSPTDFDQSTLPFPFGAGNYGSDIGATPYYTDVFRAAVTDLLSTEQFYTVSKLMMS